MSAATNPLAFGRSVPVANPGRSDIAPGIFLKQLSEQLSRSTSPYRPAGASSTDIEQLLSGVDDAKLQEIDEVSRQFESLILFSLFKQMWATLPESTMFGNGMDSEIYREMWLEQMAGEIASSGEGLGIAPGIKWEMIYRELNNVPTDELGFDTRV